MRIAQRAFEERDSGKYMGVQVRIRDVSPVSILEINRTMQLPKTQGSISVIITSPESRNRVRCSSRAVVSHPWEVPRTSYDELPTVFGALC